MLVRVQPRPPRHCRHQPKRRDNYAQPPQPAPGVAAQPRQSANGAKAQGPVQEVQVPPAVVNIAEPKRDDDDRQQSARREQQREPPRSVAEHRARASGQPHATRDAAEQREQDHHRRRGDGHPHWNIREWSRVRTDHLAEEQRADHVRMVRHQAEPLREPFKRIAPQIGQPGKETGRAEHQQRPGGGQNGRPFAPSRPQEIRTPRHGDQRHQQQGRRPNGAGDAQPRAERGEGANPSAAPARTPPARPQCPVRQQQRDHDHAEERHVLAVEEGVRVEPGVAEEEQHRKQRQRAAAEQAARQQIASERADQKEAVAQDVTGQEDVPFVGQSQSPLGGQQGDLERRPVIAQVVAQEPRVLAEHVVDRELADAVLRQLVVREPVVARGHHAERQGRDEHAERDRRAKTTRTWQ